MISPASVKDRLKNKAKQTGKPLQELYTAYGLERVLYRLSISDYSESFILKGGILLYALLSGEFMRVTRDIDLLAQQISNEEKNISEIFRNVLSITADDALVFDVENIRVISITEFKRYHGVNVSTVAYLERTRIPISIDIGFGDVIAPDKEMISFPSVLNMDTAQIYAYSKESAIAEKYEAITRLGYGNSRLKDFYDIYVLANNFDFDGNVMKESLSKTFANRKTELSDSLLYEEAFMNDPKIASRWNSFRKQKKVISNISFMETVEFIRDFLSPVVRSLREQTAFPKIWHHDLCRWV